MTPNSFDNQGLLELQFSFKVIDYSSLKGDSL